MSVEGAAESPSVAQAACRCAFCLSHGLPSPFLPGSLSSLLPSFPSLTAIFPSIDCLRLRFHSSLFSVALFPLQHYFPSLLSHFGSAALFCSLKAVETCALSSTLSLPSYKLLVPCVSLNVELAASHSSNLCLLYMHFHFACWKCFSVSRSSLTHVLHGLHHCKCLKIPQLSSVNS